MSNKTVVCGFTNGGTAIVRCVFEDAKYRIRSISWTVMRDVTPQFKIGLIGYSFKSLSAMSEALEYWISGFAGLNVVVDGKRVTIHYHQPACARCLAETIPFNQIGSSFGSISATGSLFLKPHRDGKEVVLTSDQFTID